MSGHGHHHEHAPLSGARLGLTIVLNLTITIAEVIGGVLSGSLALITDAAHNLSDVISLVVSYVAIRLSLRPRSLEFTFGWKRAQIMAAIINAAVLVVIGLMMKTPADVDAVVIKTALEAVSGVRNLHHVHMWQVDEKDRHCEGHVVLEEMLLSQATIILSSLEECLRADFGFHHCVLQIETERGHDQRLVLA